MTRRSGSCPKRQHFPDNDTVLHRIPVATPPGPDKTISVADQRKRHSHGNHDICYITLTFSYRNFIM
jgi:hypothetical protein